MPKKRYAGLDLFRVLLAAGVCAFHIKIHLKCDYGFMMGGGRSHGSRIYDGFFHAVRLCALSELFGKQAL